MLSSLATQVAAATGDTGQAGGSRPGGGGGGGGMGYDGQDGAAQAPKHDNWGAHESTYPSAGIAIGRPETLSLRQCLPLVHVWPRYGEAPQNVLSSRMRGATSTSAMPTGAIMIAVGAHTSVRFCCSRFTCRKNCMLSLAQACVVTTARLTA